MSDGRPSEVTPLSDDLRAHATMVTGISTYVATAALAVLAGAVALFTYVTQAFEPDWLFYLAIGLGALLLVVSIFAGGVGTSTVATAVANSSWGSSPGTIGAYDAQAILTLVGVVAVLAATVLGTTAPAKDDALATRVRQLEREVARLQASPRRAGRAAVRHDGRAERGHRSQGTP